MLTIILLSIAVLATTFLKLYHKSSFLLARFNKWSSEIFEHLRDTHIENIKRYLRYILIWLAIDYLVSASIVRDLLGRDMTVELFIGCVSFFIALYFLIPRPAFELINHRMDSVASKLWMPSLVFSTGAYLIPSMKLTDMTSPAYSNLPEHTKLMMLNLVFVVFFAGACLCIALLVISLLVKYFVTLNYLVSNLISNSVKSFSAHCLRVRPEEPHEVFKTWLELAGLILPGIIALLCI